MFKLTFVHNEKDDWKPVLLIVELAVCAPQSNTVLERFFSQINYIKTNTHASPSSSSLNSLLRVKVTGPTLKKYHDEHVEKVVELWCNAKNQLTQ